MTRPRSTLISLDVTPYYHCISRCVRRAFLCGTDPYSGRDFNHRKPWVLQRLKLLADVFAIDVPAYAVMRNHYHLVLHVDKARCDSWSDHEVIARWKRLFSGPRLIANFVAGKPLSEAELQTVHATIAVWRDRLYDISWFMACLNQTLARRANIEDGCTGHFWEGRFISQALLDVAALLSCMVYVDLNPIRAGIATSLEDSDFTSIQDRIRQLQGTEQAELPALMEFGETDTDQQTVPTLPYGLQDYLELADWSGRAMRPDKKGYIPADQPKILQTLGLSVLQWQWLAKVMAKESATMLNGLDTLATAAKRASVSKVA